MRVRFIEARRKFLDLLLLASSGPWSSETNITTSSSQAHPSTSTAAAVSGIQPLGLSAPLTTNPYLRHLVSNFHSSI